MAGSPARARTKRRIVELESPCRPLANWKLLQACRCPRQMISRPVCELDPTTTYTPAGRTPSATPDRARSRARARRTRGRARGRGQPSASRGTDGSKAPRNAERGDADEKAEKGAADEAEGCGHRETFGRRSGTVWRPAATMKVILSRLSRGGTVEGSRKQNRGLAPRSR
jgi:hypothetical protein